MLHSTAPTCRVPRSTVPARCLMSSKAAVIVPRVGTVQQNASSDHAVYRPYELTCSVPGVPVFRQSRPARSVQVAARTASSEPWWTKDNPPNMVEVHSVQEFVDKLADAQDKLVIVDFYATWCNACKSLFPKLCKLMAENPNVLFIKVNFDDNRQLCKSLGIKVLPFFHFYKGAEGRVEAFSCSVSKVQKFRDALELHSGAFCNLEPFSGLAEFPDVEPHAVPAELPAAQPAAAVPVAGATSNGSGNGVSAAEQSVYETLASVASMDSDDSSAVSPASQPFAAIANSNGNGANGNGVAHSNGAVAPPAAAVVVNSHGVAAISNGKGTVVPDTVPLEVLAGWRAAEVQGSSSSSSSSNGRSNGSNNSDGKSQHSGQELATV